MADNKIGISLRDLCIAQVEAMEKLKHLYEYLKANEIELIGEAGEEIVLPLDVFMKIVGKK